MPKLTEIAHRAQTGVRMDEDTFNLERVFAGAGELCGKYEIVYDPETPVPSDDAMADRLYEAAIDFVVDTGVYCSDTRRVIAFSREEVLEAVSNARGECVMGEDDDRHVWRPRKPDSDTEPWYHVGTGIFNTDERIIFNLVKDYASVKQAHSVSVPAVRTIDNYDVISGTPTEVLGAIRGIEIARDAMREAGRPGLAIGNCISTAGTHLAAIAASGPQFGLRASDGWLVGALAEMKFNMGTLNKAAYLSRWGANIGNESGPLVGGYGGGPEGVALLNVAYRLVGLLVLGCSYHLTFPVHIMKSCSTSRDVLWCVSVSSQAISRNTKELVWSLGYIAAGPMTKQFFYESAAYTAAAVSSGLSNQTCHPARAVLEDYVTPMEMCGSVELTEACVGMKRTEANELAKELLRKYEDRIEDAPIGKKYQECYDIESARPCREYVDLYGEVKEELRGMGFAYRS